MRYDRRGFLVLAAVAAAMLAGCGGGDGGDGEGAAPATVYPLSTSLRTYRPGDIWNYTLHITRGDYSRDGFAGIRVRDELLPPDNELVFLFRYNFDGGSDGSYTICRQDADTKDLLRTWSRRGFRADPPVVTLPGAWSRNVAFTRTLNGPEELRLAVTGTERVTVPAGSFETWKTTFSESNFMYESSGTYWYAPQIGQYVKAVYDITYRAGYGSMSPATYDMQLTYTNVPLGG